LTNSVMAPRILPWWAHGFLPWPYHGIFGGRHTFTGRYCCWVWYFRLAIHVVWVCDACSL